MSEQISGMIVTGIEPYPKGKGRVSVYLNDEFAFVLYKGELSKYAISVGSTVDDELYKRILDETLILRAKKRGMNLLKSMDRTEYDVRCKLREGGYPEEAVEAAVTYLKSYHYVDDLRYALEYIRCRITNTSIRMIRSKLSAKGIGNDVIERAFADYDEESGNNPADAEEELIRSLIIKRCPEGVSGLDYTAKQKLFSYLYQKGFSVSAIERTYRSFNT